MNQWKFYNALTLVQLSCPSSRKDTDVLHLQILVITVVNLIQKEIM